MLPLIFPGAASVQADVYTWKYPTLVASSTPRKNIVATYPLFVIHPEVKKTDTRLEKLQGYLDSKKSPLAPHSPQIIEEADKYGLDWRLLVAITGVESGFGKIMPSNSHNAYGWANGTTRFESWEKSIEHVSKVLGEKYIAKGLKTPDQIMQKYCPGSTTWANSVKMYMKHIDSFTSES